MITINCGKVFIWFQPITIFKDTKTKFEFCPKIPIQQTALNNAHLQKK